MAAHRYWRIKVNANGGATYTLLCEVKMYLRGTATPATGGTASASGVNGTNTAAKAIDGLTTTYWEYQNSNVWPQWWQVDYGAGNAKDIGSIDISSYSSFPTEMPTDFEIQWSDDGATFTSVFRAQNLSAWSTSQTLSFPVPDTVDANYYAYRLNVSAVNGGTFLSIAEFALRETAGGDSLATGRARIYSTQSGTFLANNAFDSSLTTTWETASGTTTGSIGIILPAKVAPVEFVLSCRSTTGREATMPMNFSLQGSTDGVTWTSIRAITSETGWTAGQSRTYSATAAATVARPLVFVCT